MDFSLQQLCVIAVGGLVAGLVNGTVGGGSLLTYAVLSFMGTPPVIAAATNTTGLSTGNAAALIPHLDGTTVNLREWSQHALWTATGTLCGGLALILLPEKVFEFLVPLLLIAASIFMLLPPRPVRLDPARPARTKSLLFGSGIYNGYFGPGQGVIAISILNRDGRLNLNQSVVIKNLVLALSNIVVAVLFIATGHVLWPAAIALLGSVAVGGWIGGTISDRINPQLLRFGVAAVGFASAAWFLVR